jgi:ParB/RepB/Spo0J family partition protein
MKTRSTLPLPDTIAVGLNGIMILPGRLRALRPEIVNELAQSMSASGLLQPIVLRPRRGSGYYLVAGRHRLQAAKKLKWPSIKALVLTGIDADAAELAEIDENLIRADLSPAERKLHVARRKELYDNRPDAAKRGGDRKSKKSKSHNESLISFVKATASKTGKGRSTVARDVTHAKKVVVLSEIAGTCLDHEAEIDALAHLPAEEQHKLAAEAKAGNKTSAKHHRKKMNRDQRELELAGKVKALPDRRYGVIVADPEWQWEPWSHATGMDRAAANHYPTSIVPVIAARDVPSISAKDCVLFLWATIPMLPHALVVMAAWEFDYVSHYAWGKDRIGTGFWNREKHELLLIGVRGGVPCPAQGEQWASLIMAPRGEHSQKPECFLQMIEEYFPNVPKIELNRRGAARPGWNAWGNEAAEAAE